MLLRKIAAGTVAALLTAAPAFAVTFTLDDFETAQSVSADPASSDTIFAGTFVGTSRTLFADTTIPDGTTTTTLQSGPDLAYGEGVLSFSTTAGRQGVGSVTYTDVDLQNTLAEGYFLFVIAPGLFDNGADADFFAELNDGTTTLTYSENLAGGFSPILRFTDLVGDTASFDFGSVDTLTFGFDTSDTVPSIDGVLLDIVVSAVPVPASGLMLLGAAGGFAALRRRKKA